MAGGQTQKPKGSGHPEDWLSSLDASEIGFQMQKHSLSEKKENILDLVILITKCEEHITQL